MNPAQMTNPVAVQFVLSTNDAVEVSFSDGSRLELSPCGSAFAHHALANQDDHALKVQPTTIQRTQFTTSVYLDKVCQALDFRNRFVNRPYLCQHLIDNSAILRTHTDVSMVSWPASASECDFRVLANGNVCLSSSQGQATVCISANQHTFTARYLAKMSAVDVKTGANISSGEANVFANDSENALQSRCSNVKTRSMMDDATSSKVSNSLDKVPLRRCPSKEVEVNISTVSSSSCDLQVDGRVATILNGSSADHCWVTQHHSVDNVPDAWSHPIKLLRDFVRSSRYIEALSSFQGKSDGSTEKWVKSHTSEEGRVSLVETILPKTLSLKCPAPHLHKWNADGSEKKFYADGFCFGKVKVVYSKGTIYRLIWEQPCSIEMYPEDGSFIQSTGQTGHLFRHILYNNGQIEERTYSALHPPPTNANLNYSVAKIISLATRLLQVLLNENLQLINSEENVCYKYGKELHNKTHRKDPHLGANSPTFHVLEECEVSGVGRFTARTSGAIRIVFVDRTCLDMSMDTIADQNGKTQICRSASVHRKDVPPGTCRLLLPTGHYQYVSISEPGQFAKYTHAAMEWISWIRTPPADRPTFYKDTIYDVDRNDDVARELKRIECFSYILVNSVLPQCGMSRSQSDSVSPVNTTPLVRSSDQSNESFSHKAVQEVLQRTVDAVKDLDNFLKLNGEVKPVKDV